MAKRNLVQEAASKNPSVVLRAFAPEKGYVMSLDGWIFLEAMGSPFTNGGKPGLGDLVLAALVMTDTDAVIKARRTGKLEELIRTATRGKRPADVIPLTDALAAAIEAAFEPADSGVEAEKKDSAAPDGGSA